MGTSGAMTKDVGQDLKRSPRVLKPLIEEQIEMGYHAGEEFFKEAGVMLLEARDGIAADREWGKYISSLRVDGSMVTPGQVKAWMRLGRSERLGLGHKTVKSAESDPRTRSQNPTGGSFGRRRSGVRAEHSEIREKDIADHRAHRRAQRAEMLLLVAAGYKQMAQKRHPDIGGSNDAMVLLKESRDILMRYAEKWS